MFYRNKLILVFTVVSALLVPWLVWGDTTSTLTKSVTANIGTTGGLALDATITGLFPTAFSSADAVAAQTATLIHGGMMAWNGTGWDRLQVDASKNLKVNMAACTGCATDGATFTIGSSNTSSIGAVSTGKLNALITCDSSAIVNTSSSGNTVAVALSSSKVIYVCGWEATSSTSSATNISLLYGTQSSTPCDTGATTISDTVRIASGGFGLQGKVSRSPFYQGIKTAASKQLCVSNSAAVQIDVIVYYTQF